MKKNLLILTLIASACLAAQNAQAKKLDGGSDRGGGDAFVIRSKIFNAKKQSLIAKTEDLFNGKNQIDLRNVLSWFNRSSVVLSDAKSNAILIDMRAKGFAKNLFVTDFKLRKSCIDKNGVSKTATTGMNQPGSDICINAKKLVDEFGPYIQDSDIAGLMMHEYSHHFGYEDKDHSFAAATAEAFQKDSENQNEEGAPLNYLLK